jgi:hypothetical protein
MPLPGSLPITAPGGDLSCTTQNVIAPAQTVLDGCPVLPKIQCHQINMGQSARLLWNFKNPQGLPVNLEACVDDCAQSSNSISEPLDAGGGTTCGVLLRIRELSGYDPQNDQLFVVGATVLDPATGLVRSDHLPAGVVTEPGIYMEEWAVISPEGLMLFSNQCYLFVQQGLFGITDVTRRYFGPPSFQEIRLSLRDNSGADNSLLDDVEFDAAEIAMACLRPVRRWNEIPPPLTPFTTKTFPFKEMWILGIQAYLLEIAAHNYRRNQLAYSAGGIQVDDKNKEPVYAKASMTLMQQFNEMLKAKKMEINTRLMWGGLGSAYSRSLG